MNLSKITDLPKEILADIFMLNDGYTLGKCRRVCTTWREFIDETDYLWCKMCKKDFECSSIIAKRKSGDDCKWYYIYRNLRLWCDSKYYFKKFKEFYKYDVNALDVDNGILPIRESKEVVLFDMSTLKQIPITLPEKNCIRIANNDDVTAILLPGCKLLVQRTVHLPNYMSETMLSAENFALSDEYIYYYENRDIYRCNIKSRDLSIQFVVNCNYDIVRISHEYGVTCIYTKCRQFLNILCDNSVVVQPIKCPNEWLPQLKNMNFFNHKNFVSYSHNIFFVETDKRSHLYMHFPEITASFFYGDIVLIGTNTGEILLYKMFDEKTTKKFYKDDSLKHMLLVKLPNNKFALKIDVCERKAGSVIFVTTFLQVFMINVSFHPAEEDFVPGSPKIYSQHKINMFKRLLKVKERMQKLASE